jgi:small-conductance mechanosensitive channel
MAFPWMMALKVIPWGDVIEHAPKVLKGARRLLDKQKAQAAPEASAAAGTDSLPQRLQALEAAHHQLQADMAQLAQTAAELAEQNNRLVQAVEVLRWRTRWLGGACVALLLGGVALAMWG